MQISATQNDREVMIALEGELDLATSPQLEAACPEAARQARRVVIDLSGLSFIDSTGLRALLSANTSGQREGLELTLIRGPERQGV
jgi:anti-sigma B factor antagonist